MQRNIKQTELCLRAKRAHTIADMRSVLVDFLNNEKEQKLSSWLYVGWTNSGDSVSIYTKLTGGENDIILSYGCDGELLICSSYYVRNRKLSAPLRRILETYTPLICVRKSRKVCYLRFPWASYNTYDADMKRIPQVQYEGSEEIEWLGGIAIFTEA